MQAIANGRRRVSVRSASLASVVLAIVLVGGIAGMLSIGNDKAVPSSTAPDTTTLVLDREGADLLAPSTDRLPDITGLNLDREGADSVTPVPGRTAPDATRLNLDRNGADVP